MQLLLDAYVLLRLALETPSFRFVCTTRHYVYSSTVVSRSCPTYTRRPDLDGPCNMLGEMHNRASCTIDPLEKDFNEEA